MVFFRNFEGIFKSKKSAVGDAEVRTYYFYSLDNINEYYFIVSNKVHFRKAISKRRGVVYINDREVKRVLSKRFNLIWEDIKK